MRRYPSFASDASAFTRVLNVKVLLTDADQGRISLNLNLIQVTMEVMLRTLAFSICVGLLAVNANAQLRVSSWNVTFWGIPSVINPSVKDATRINGVKTCLYTVNPANGMQYAPDIIFGQEFLSSAGQNTFLTCLNTAPGSPGDYVAATYVDGPSMESVMFYRNSKVRLVSATPVIAYAGGSAPLSPRNILRYDFYPVGYNHPTCYISVFNCHLQAGSTIEEQNRRYNAAIQIRQRANELSPRGGIMVVGDFNVQNAQQAAYVELTASQLDNSGRMIDPINRDSNQGGNFTGNWNNNSAYRYIHTQDPAPGASGMDDRLDFILMDANLLDGDGMGYIGNPNIPFSATTWNDPNHSYRAFGNGGDSYNTSLRIVGNAQVGPVIAQALIDTMKDEGTAYQPGHIPIYVDMTVPPIAKIVSTGVLDFGLVDQGATISLPFEMRNDGNISLWTANGIAPLTYTFDQTGAFKGPTGIQTHRAGSPANIHQITVDTTTPGRKTGIITIQTNDTIRPTLTFPCVATVVGRTVRPR
jgi:hypothetical protein